MTKENLKKEVSKITPKSGIYLFKGLGNKPIYIGKALNLKNRVGQYLKTDDPRLQKMISMAKRIDFIQTESEIEALILESQFIKKYRPSFNIMLRDDKQYFYVGFTKEKFPKIFTTHQPWPSGITPRLPNSCFIGPFTDGNALKSTLRYLRRIFPYCTCKQAHNNYCLNYHIGKCLGFCCLKKQNPENQGSTLKKCQGRTLNSYRKNINAIKKILSSKKTSLIKDLRKEMALLAKRGDLEKAIELRGKLEKLKKVFENAKIIRNWKLETGNLEVKNSQHNISYKLKQLLKLDQIPVRIEGYDVSNIQGAHATGSMVVFINGKADKNQYRKFKINIAIHHDRGILKSNKLPGDTGMLKEVLSRRFNHPEWPFPDLIIVDGGKQQLRVAEAVANSKSETLNPKQIPIIAVTKNKKHVGEKIYISGKKFPISLTKLAPANKNLFLAIDSEAHRFAISYYRKLHRKSLR